VDLTQLIARLQQTPDERVRKLAVESTVLIEGRRNASFVASRGQLCIYNLEIQMPRTKTTRPKFRTEKQEAEWWDANPALATDLLNQALKHRSVRRRFVLSAKEWTSFQVALDAPPRPAPRLAKLLRQPSVFDREPRG
jgi:hypothetical protein